ncbi:phage tail protein [Jeotgalibaca porci]|uniref:phage tail protein n=1 Tax=Jeotgalibaca porci TaxID=1868793 RepID=UPI0035A0C762
MAIKGLELVTVALVDENQQIIKGADKGLSESGIYEIDTKDMGTKTANITGMEGTSTKVWGNNQMQDMAIGAASPSIALAINNLNFKIRNMLLGNEPDGKGGFVYSGKKPNVAILVQSHSVKTNQSVYFGFGYGIMGMASQNIGTNTENETREDDSLTFTALTTKAFNGQPIKFWSEAEEGFDKTTMMSEVFGGYTAPVTPAK